MSSDGASPLDRVVIGATEVDGRMCATRQRLRVVDHGTGAASALACLGLDHDDADEVVAAEVAAGRLAGPVAADHDGPDDRIDDVTIDLHPALDGEVTAVVSAQAGSDRLVTQAVGELADRILGVLTRDRLEVRTGTHLHGAALRDPAGRTVLVLAASGTGKSTMTAHLAAGGLDLLTDEQVRVHPGPGLVSTFTRPVAVKPGGAPYLPEPVARRIGATTTSTLLPASELGSRPGVAGRPALVVLPERDADAEPGWELLGSLEAVDALAANNLDLEARPREGLRALAWLVGTAPVVRTRHRSSAELSALTRTLLDDPPAPASPPQVEAAAPQPDHLITVTAPDGALVFDPRTLRLVRLNRSGARMWLDRHDREWATDVDGRDFRAELERLGLL